MVASVWWGLVAALRRAFLLLCVPSPDKHSTEQVMMYDTWLAVCHKVRPNLGVEHAKQVPGAAPPHPAALLALPSAEVWYAPCRFGILWIPAQTRRMSTSKPSNTWCNALITSPVASSSLLIGASKRADVVLCAPPALPFCLFV